MADVPWFIGATGAQHSAEVARSLVYDATNGAAGIVRVGDCKVTQTASASSSVQIGAGGILLPNVSPGGGGQSYADYVSTAQTLAIPATTSGGGRSDLIVRTIEDPQYGGHSNNPADPAVGPYAFFRRFSVPGGTTDVSALGLTYPAVALARIDLPASTSIITDAMITDLREVAIPRKKRTVYPYNLGSTDTDDLGVDEPWPNLGGIPVDVPSWATRANVIVTWAQVEVPAGCTQYGLLYGRFVVNGETKDTGTVGFRAENPPSMTRETFILGAQPTIPAAMRGKSGYFQPRANPNGGTGQMQLDGYSSIIADIEFIERAE